MSTETTSPVPWLGRISQSWRACLFILIVAGLMLKISHNILIQAGGLDPFIYTSYIQNYGDLIDRFGVTYYSLRVAHIFPSTVITRLLGTEAGYVAYRYVLLCVALGAIWSLSRKHYTVSVAFFATMLAACHPWLLRSLFWEHYDSSGVVYLLIATSLLGGAAPTDRWKLFLAGAAYGFAAICNVYLLGLCFPLFASYFFVNLRFRLKEWILPGIIALAGFLTAYISSCITLNALLHKHVFVFDLFSLKFAARMLTGGGEQWHLNVLHLIQQGWAQLLVPAIVLLAMAALMVARGGKQKPVVLHAALNLFLVIAICIFVDVFQRAAVISLFYYFIYLFPATLFGVIVLAGEVAEAVDPHTSKMILGGCGALCLVGYALVSIWPALFAAMSTRWTPVLAAMAVGGAALAVRHAKASLALLTLAAAASPLPFYKMPTHIYSAIHTGDPRLEWDVYRAAIQLQRLVVRYPAAKGAIGFWYADRPGARLDSVQSMYLWGLSRLTPAGNAAMPTLTDGARARMRRVHFLVLLAETAAEIDVGKLALAAAGFDTRTVEQASYDGQQFHVKYLVLERLSIATPSGPFRRR